MEILFVIDPPLSLKEHKDSSIAMMRAAQARGHGIWICQPHELHLWEGRVVTVATQIEVKPGAAWFEEAGMRTRLLTDFAAVLMRKDPPLDQDYLTATHLLSLAEEHGARVFNRPAALRDYQDNTTRPTAGRHWTAAPRTDCHSPAMAGNADVEYGHRERRSPHRPSA